MGFEVRPTGLRPQHPRLGIAAAVLIGAILVGVGVAARSAPATAPARAEPSSRGRVAASPVAVHQSPAAVGATLPAGSPRPLPATLECRDVTRLVCTKAATAAMAILPADLPAISGATVWHSLLCSVLPDCPPQLLTRESVPLGSVIVTFADAGPEAWINVVEHEGGPDGLAIRPARAWIVRWH
jgi:hypothetical protein